MRPPVVASMFLLLALDACGCGGKRVEPVVDPGEKAAPPAPIQPTDEPADPEAAARQTVTAFLGLIRQERYEEAYESTSHIMKQSYDYDTFLKVAGKLEMEELPCITDRDIEEMEPTSGHVGLGPKDVVVEGFLIRYGCGEDRDRVLVVFLDWSRMMTPPGGVASMYWK